MKIDILTKNDILALEEKINLIAESLMSKFTHMKQPILLDIIMINNIKLY